MSKVAITGNASGSGTFTLAAPNSNSDRTLTLPDVTGTIVTTGSSPSFPTTIGVGGATPSTSGAGITFPATQSASSDANTLDDYEEGTWTPNFAATSGSFGTITWFNQTGRYTKIGNVVTAWARADAETVAIGTASGTFLITGLPFTSSSVAAMYAGSGFRGGGTGPLTLGQLLVASSTQLRPLKQDGNPVEVSNLVSGGRNDFGVTITYMI
jgi:hypothetical protein